MVQPNQDVSSAIDAFFSIGNAGVGTGSAIKESFKVRSSTFHSTVTHNFSTISQKIVTTALDAFMENTDIGQHTEQKYFIYMQHNAVVRLGVMVRGELVTINPQKY